MPWEEKVIVTMREEFPPLRKEKMIANVINSSANKNNAAVR